MISFLLALQFLTAIPVKVKKFSESKLAASMMFFPVIGFFIAILLIAINIFFLCFGFYNFIINIILVVALIAITAGMHLDGLSDTFDAICSAKSKERMLEIMRDSRCGVMGVLSIISVVLLKIAFLSSIKPMHKISALVLMCVFGRWVLVFMLYMFPYVREEGKGKIFSERINSKIFIMATIFSLSCALIFLATDGLAIMALAMLVAFLFGKFMLRKIGGITGDNLGAVCELVETAVLFAIAII
ncbi:MAG: adenosylcobinamide-GDP ribazoletransferase [Candidatus Omnitrophota bacterium]